ncbi:esterase-like activity of phytase family protein [Zunongwangia sp.]|uniref:esterase-like activity of phytase family protein n=1 Tax=Zunongwangia sp. TaxID=1965325 RepID=UPI003AA7C430
MKKISILAILSLFLSSCATTRKIKNEEVQLKFLDEYIINADKSIDGTKIGGLSGIDYKDGYYYFIVDVPNKARFYKASIPIKNNKIDTILFDKTIFINKKDSFFDNHVLDPESIRITEDGKDFIISSEGSVTNARDPSVFIVDSQGNYKSSYQIPDYFKASGSQKPRHNGVFEGITNALTGNGIWVSTELPLVKDGPKPKLFPTKSYSRITYFDNKTKKATKQFAYKLDGISKIPWLYFAINGITEILEYKKDHFLLLERAFSAGHGSHSNTVRIFEVNVENATNTLDAESLKKIDFKPAKKKLLFDFKNVKDQLTDGIVDNIEGICFGPKLTNGNQSVLVISDNNFNSFTKQLTQVILLELTAQ